MNPGETIFDGALEQFGGENAVQSLFNLQRDEDSRVVDSEEQSYSYQAAITSLAEQEQKEALQNTQDMDAEVFDQLMLEQGEESKSQSASDSMLHTSNSPWNNSFTRNETEMVVATIRKESLHS